MTISTRRVGHQHEGVALEGALVVDDSWDAARPAVLVFHGIEGRSDDQLDFAKRLAEWGYAGLAVDLFGTEATAAGLGRCQELMTTFMQDREMLRKRLLHVVDVARSLTEVDGGRVAAIGFCFGGLAVLDLARAGADVTAVASFHGVLTPPDGAATGEVRTKVIVFHGWDDPFAPPDDVVALGRELTARDADWQIHAYGHAMHAFMAPGAADPEAGIQYNEVAERRAWASLKGFLAEAFT